MTLSPAPGTPQTAVKAVIASVVSFFGTFIVSLWTIVSGRPDIDNLSTTHWLIIILGSLATTVTAGGLVYQIPNSPK